MSRNKRPNGADDIYTRHLNGTMFKNNPAINREALIERMLIRVLSELAMNRFKWTGMPDSIDTRFLEMTLFQRALAVFYRDKKYDKFFALQGGGNNFLNMMNNPTGFVVIGNNFVSKQVSAVKETEEAGIAVPIWANYVRVPDIDIVLIYANRLANLDRTIEINSQNARQNKYVATNENQRLTAVNINRQMDEGLNGIQVSGAFQDMDLLKVIDLGINPDTIEKLSIVRARMWNECMGLLGIENANQDKKERLVAAEVDANDEQTSSMKYVNLNARRMACEQINKVYGLNVWVEYNTEVDRLADKIIDSQLSASTGVTTDTNLEAN